MKKEIAEWIKAIVIALVIALIIKSFILDTTRVEGDSMYPTLHERDRLINMKITLKFDKLRHGDIVIFKAPDDIKKDYIKRVIGLPGDVIEISDGNVYRNGNIIQEAYIEEGVSTGIYNESYWEVPDGFMFVLGDNRRHGRSKDSRSLGCIDMNSVKGRAKLRYFPISRIGFLN